MADVTIEIINNTHLKVNVKDYYIDNVIVDYFSFFVPNHKHIAKVKEKKWDGKIRLYNKKERTLYLGLYGELINLLKSQGMTYTLHDEHGILDSLDKKEIYDVVSKYEISLKNKVSGEYFTIKPYSFQMVGVITALSKKKRVLVSPTSSGKTLMMYYIAKYLSEEQNKKILIIEPLVDLVEQVYSDFESFSHINGFDVEKNCHKIYAGKEKYTDKNIIISTWQSLAVSEDIDEDYFEQFDCVIVDECHLASSKSFTTILSSCVNAEYRIGFTGTMHGDDLSPNNWVIEGLLGKIKIVTNMQEMFSLGIVSSLEIKAHILGYALSERKRRSYQVEVDFIEKHRKRNEYIVKLIDSLEGNVLILFRHVDKHGEELKKIYEEISNKKHVFINHGKVDKKKKTEIRESVEKIDEVALFASYGTFSTGISVNNIQHIIFASPYKERIKVMQSIGRGLRKDGKLNHITLHDLVDDCGSNAKKPEPSYSMEHFQQRFSLYRSPENDFKTDILKVNI